MKRPRNMKAQDCIGVGVVRSMGGFDAVKAVADQYKANAVPTESGSVFFSGTQAAVGSTMRAIRGKTGH